MKALGSTLNYKQNKLVVNIYLGIWIIICLVFNSISYWIYNNLYKMDVLVVIFPSYFILNSAFGVVMSIYFFFIFSIKSRYCMLNENLRFVT